MFKEIPQFVPFCFNKRMVVVIFLFDWIEKRSRYERIPTFFPDIASGSLAGDILQRFVKLSIDYGTTIRIEGDRAYFEIPD